MSYKNTNMNNQEFEQLQDSMHIMDLKNILIIAKKYDIIEDISSPEDYGWFIDTLNIALGEEPAFFLMDEEFLKIAEKVLQSKRFEYQHLEGYNDVINEIIGKINTLENSSSYEKAVKVKNYILWNIETRGLPITLSNQDLYKTLAYDSIVLEATSDGEIPEITTPLFVASTNYILATAPDFYDAYPLAKETTISYLEEESKKHGLHNWHNRRVAKSAVKNFKRQN